MHGDHLKIRKVGFEPPSSWSSLSSHREDGTIRPGNDLIYFVAKVGRPGFFGAHVHDNKARLNFVGHLKNASCRVLRYLNSQDRFHGKVRGTFWQEISQNPTIRAEPFVI